MASETVAKWSIIVLFVVTGTLLTVLSKLLYQGNFQLPWTLNLAMEFGMALSLPFYFIAKWIRSLFMCCRRDSPETAPGGVAIDALASPVPADGRSSDAPLLHEGNLQTQAAAGPTSHSLPRDGADGYSAIGGSVHTGVSPHGGAQLASPSPHMFSGERARGLTTFGPESGVSAGHQRNYTPAHGLGQFRLPVAYDTALSTGGDSHRAFSGSMSARGRGAFSAGSDGVGVSLADLLGPGARPGDGDGHSPAARKHSNVDRGEKAPLLVSASGDDLEAERLSHVEPIADGYMTTVPSATTGLDAAVVPVVMDDSGHIVVPEVGLPSTAKEWLILALRVFPCAVCDTMAGGLMNVGLLGMSASVWQMIRGAVILFTVALRFGFFRARLFRFEAAGIALVMVGLVVVGVAGVSDVSAGADIPAWLAVVSILVVLLSQLFLAGQTVIEEMMLKLYAIPEMVLVGLEGTWGCIINAIILAVVSYVPASPCNVAFGISEDVEQITAPHGSSKYIPPLTWGFLVAFVICVTVYNITGQAITRYTTGTTHTVMDNVRTVIIWVVMIVAYAIGTRYWESVETTISPLVYATNVTTTLWPDDDTGFHGLCQRLLDQNDDGMWGEAVNKWTALQLAGFVVLAAGIFVYTRVVEFRRMFFYPSDEEAEAAQGGLAHSAA
eukprot:TRINITY_DN44585_c0_g1_i1.p1 TRINITY_DN44585_c0_g1~~TRINITY_DN44585_c0_g1_i1.p1  ORF type:complete len:667 (+),score=138.10 TRINITY_DN44585_c0_g1_i1:161-2161(+)